MIASIALHTAMKLIKIKGRLQHELLWKRLFYSLSILILSTLGWQLVLEPIFPPNIIMRCS
jgi:hypothetical protein